MPAFAMSASSDKVTCGTMAGLGTPPEITVITLCQRTDEATTIKLYQKGLFPNIGTICEGINFGTAQINCALHRATSNAACAADTSAFRSYRLGAPIFVVCQTSIYTAAHCRLLVGNMSELPTEPSVYLSQSNGSGTQKTWGGGIEWIIGNKSNSATPFVGWIGFQAMWPRILTTDEIHRVCRMFMPGSLAINPQIVPGPGLFMLPGLKGLSTKQMDYSGWSNHGTIVGGSLTAVPGLVLHEPNWRSQRRAWFDIAAVASTWPGYQSPFGWR